MAQFDLPPETWDALLARVRAHPGTLTWAWIAQRHGDGWRPIVAVLRSGASEARDFRYPDLVVHIEQPSPSGIADRLAVRCAGEVDGQAVALTPQPGQFYPVRRTTQRARHIVGVGPWPYVLADIRLDDSTSQLSAHRELVAPGMPFFASPAHAAAELVFGVPVEILGNENHARVVIALADERGAIEELVPRGGALVVRTRGNGNAQLAVRGTWSQSETDVNWRHVDASVRGGVATFAIDRMPNEAVFLLVTADGDVLDRRAWTARYGDRPEDNDEPTAVEELERWLSELEHQRLEYKQQLGGENTREFAKDVCAFSNTDGGVVLIGVNDHGVPVGYPAADSKVKVLDLITNALFALVEPAPRWRAEQMYRDGTSIWIVRVEPGPSRPYVVDTVPYVRDKGISRPPRREELMGLVRRDTNEDVVSRLSRF